MKRFLLDTNICIHLINGQYNLAAKLDEVGVANCFLSSITIAELLYGVENSAPARQANNRRNLAELQQLFNGRILSFESALKDYAVQKAHLKRLGRLQAEFDILIGCTALAHDLTLVTRNIRHFADLAGIRLENWIDTPPASELANESATAG